MTGYQLAEVEGTKGKGRGNEGHGER